MKDATHPDRYGFTLDPDGVLTVLGSTALTGVTVAVTGVGNHVAAASSALGSIAGSESGPILFLMVLAMLLLSAEAVVSSGRPRFFSQTGRFHLWMAAIGVLLALGAVVLWSWTLPLEWGWLIRAGATLVFLSTMALSLRRHLLPRREWVRNQIEQQPSASE